MRKIALMGMMCLMVASLNGCTTVQQIPAEDLAATVKAGAELAAVQGLRLAMDKKPDDAEKIKENAKLAAEVIRKTILPTFEGAATADVLRSAVDVALEKLNEKLSPEVRAAIQFALAIVASQVKLPANPADKLDERVRKAVAAFFSGLASGIDTAVTAARDLQPPTLTWPAAK